mmetsp:Transcript_49181/g.124814  ORF Transcript_49181/g.124814 Transcript_49181/m.124814 type:complete len:316 (-) Transcript_49181:115-1062(-)|eukprot:CAMPEP_0183445860 /NCGR_PEP_ID=MMETSP0370-20130417/96573_1 /TAXON_ID=268820 /ORGANISM="Peridinium aciculiferum, Strain PAER-2" /LENGTH=315 /DNA_ID=CAMNT_0025636505 /DNA_START=58 /DNA_END=1005 /DNA_ORIENTATION=-
MADIGHSATEEEGVSTRRRSVSVHDVGSGLRAYTPTLWQARQRQVDERPKQERDSLRSRSNEGRPGSRKHRRWARSQELIGSLRRVMAAQGEEYSEVDIDTLMRDQLVIEHRPSAFYRLLEREGPDGALDAWAAAESARRPRSRPRRTKTSAQVELENARCVRNAFGDNWQYIHSSPAAKDLLVELETMATTAFGSMVHAGEEQIAIVSEWHLDWDGTSFTTTLGKPPSDEMAIAGLDASQRKFVHQFARLLGLHSQSRILDVAEVRASAGGGGGAVAGDAKVLLIRPPRRHCIGGKPWEAPLSIASILRATTNF